jgi:hypothetical protein
MHLSAGGKDALHNNKSSLFLATSPFIKALLHKTRRNSMQIEPIENILLEKIKNLCI